MMSDGMKAFNTSTVRFRPPVLDIYACDDPYFQHLNGTIQTYCSSPVTPVERRYCKVGSRMLQDKLVSRRSCMNTGKGDEIP